MYNTPLPNAADLPSKRKLLRSTLIALAVAIALLITVVLPAEYAIDPTGIGRMLGLTEMGEIKGQLAEEATADAARDAALAAQDAADKRAATPVEPSAEAAAAVAPTAGSSWRDQMQVVLQPGEGAEIKLAMKAGQRAQFSWSAQGGAVNFDTHGDGGGQSISYEKGRSVPADDGEIEAAFDGNHGWYWRNRGDAPVTVVVRVRGQYTDIKRVA
ncbi:transmembrane anchor protein [Thermomonas sp. XSG]|uniref:transmembrane anchor protein n=1 Tax=Thermomonas sp. XSG TaxID=2771436 RepID=UPI0016807782|nr:transmembrane anchor protein [Thermomonas sp. XSG]QNU15210.1 transmembrane anchor protein [Thermomonas sp. XSG]